MAQIIKTIQAKYYSYVPGEFLPVYVNGQLANKKQFHAYRLRWLLSNRRLALYMFTHYAG